jgi:transcriptional regulator with XRE-family HTH domain
LFSFSNFDKRVKEKGVSKTFIAQKLGRNSTIFHDWSKGKSSPSEEALGIVAECLDCTVSFLRGHTSDPQVEVILADPDKVREHEEQMEAQRQENLRRLVAADPLAGLSAENREKALEYIELLKCSPANR